MIVHEEQIAIKENAILLKGIKQTHASVIKYLEKINKRLDDLENKLRLCTNTRINIRNETNINHIKKRLFDLLNNNINNQKKDILKSKTLKEACIKCKLHKLSGQQIGPLLEKYIIQKNNMVKQPSYKCNGDCLFKSMHIEIKVSLGGINHDKFNYVQIRVNHNINFYLLIAYYLSRTNMDTLGELFIFKIPKDKIIPMILKYGNYAHGTISKNGKIDLSDLNNKNNNKEYSIRPKYGDVCWNNLLDFRVYSIE